MEMTIGTIIGMKMAPITTLCINWVITAITNIATMISTVTSSLVNAGAKKPVMVAVTPVFSDSMASANG